MPADTGRPGTPASKAPHNDDASAHVASASVVLVRVLIEALERAGVNREALLQSEPAVDAALADVNARIALTTVERLHDRALDLTGDEGLGLKIGQYVTESAFDVLAHLVAHAPTMREAIALIGQFARLIRDGSALVLCEDHGTAVVRIEFSSGASARSDRLTAEFAASAVLRMIRMFGGSTSTVTAARFPHRRPPYFAEYSRVFSGVERFGQPFLGIAFDSALLDRPHLHRHPALLAVLRSEAERSLDRLTRNLRHEERVRDFLMTKPPAQMPDMDEAARGMGISPRSLRRRLALEGVSYRAIVQSALETLATRMLEDPNRTIQETAHAMGFSDATAFHRAFKRWTGLTPQQYRAVPR